eukprot:284817204_4
MHHTPPLLPPSSGLIILEPHFPSSLSALPLVNLRMSFLPLIKVHNLAGICKAIIPKEAPVQVEIPTNPIRHDQLPRRHHLRGPQTYLSPIRLTVVGPQTCPFNLLPQHPMNQFRKGMCLNFLVMVPPLMLGIFPPLCQHLSQPPDTLKLAPKNFCRPSNQVCSLPQSELVRQSISRLRQPLRSKALRFQKQHQRITRRSGLPRMNLLQCQQLRRQDIRQLRRLARCATHPPQKKVQPAIRQSLYLFRKNILQCQPQARQDLPPLWRTAHWHTHLQKSVLRSIRPLQLVRNILTRRLARRVTLQSRQLARDTPQPRRLARQGTLQSRRLARQGTLQSRRLARQGTLQSRGLARDTLQARQLVRQDTLRSRRLARQDTLQSRRLARQGTRQSRRLARQGTLQSRQLARDIPQPRRLARDIPQPRRLARQGTLRSRRLARQDTLQSRRLARQGTRQSPRLARQGTRQSRRLARQDILQSRRLARQGTRQSRRLARQGTLQSRRLARWDTLQARRLARDTLQSRRLADTLQSRRLARQGTLHSRRLARDIHQHRRLGRQDTLQSRRLARATHQHRRLERQDTPQTQLVAHLETLQPSQPLRDILQRRRLVILKPPTATSTGYPPAPSPDLPPSVSSQYPPVPSLPGSTQYPPVSTGGPVTTYPPVYSGQSSTASTKLPPSRPEELPPDQPDSPFENSRVPPAGKVETLTKNPNSRIDPSFVPRPSMSTEPLQQPGGKRYDTDKYTIPPPPYGVYTINDRGQFYPRCCFYTIDVGGWTIVSISYVFWLIFFSKALISVPLVINLSACVRKCILSFHK